MKSHERLKGEARVERDIESVLLDELVHLDENMVFHADSGDFLIEVTAHYLGSRSKRLVE